MASLRESMPETTAFIDAMREAFGAEMINTQIKKGMAGEVGFYANENGHEVGTVMLEHGVYVSLTDMVTQSEIESILPNAKRK